MTRDDRRFPLAALLVAIPFGISTALAVVLLLRTGSGALPFLALFGVTAFALTCRDRFFRSKASIRIALLLCGLNLAVILPELVLRIVDFRFVSGIQFGYPRPDEFLRFKKDPVVFWRHPAAAPGVNSLGVKDDEVVLPKPEGTTRLLFLGDSCTEQGYFQIAEQLLNELYPRASGSFDAVSLAVSGYTSYQGLRMAELYAEELDPDLVVVYFGWNDHWRAYGAVDSAKAGPTASKPLPPVLDKLYGESRVLQALAYAMNRSSRSQGVTEIAQTRVSPEEYRQNLIGIKDLFRERGVPVLFITAPTAHYKLGVPDYLIELAFAADKETVTRLHAQYTDIVREVAVADGAYLLDLEESIRKRSDLENLFSPDGIHFSYPGLVTVAVNIARFAGTEIPELTPDED